MHLSFLCLGICIHFLLLYAIFDIYYSSPIIKGARSFPIVTTTSNASVQAPADRLVFFSGDGLRARAFFDHPRRSPFLHSLIKNGLASWGIAQSHVPTESRPGHVAMMAGFYEDVSAVTHGWKQNPVPFDSTLNQSTHAFLWGSPDIIHLFSKNIQNAYADVYAPELEDFASKDAAQLDKWVFKKVKEFFHHYSDKNMEKQISMNIKGSIFFLHLLGLDTNGHGHKPQSEQYLANIQNVDDGVRDIVELFERHFPHNRTAYIFTSDHGMTDWGSHGDGTDDEVRIPFVAWGAGILPSARQLELAQVDIAPLQSALLGIAIPVNSFGIVPVQLLSAGQEQQQDKYRFQAAYANFKQISEQFTIRRADRRAHSFRAFFTECPTLQFDALAKINSEILRLAQLKRYEAAWKVCIKWIPLIREALNYFHRYHQFSQGLAIGALFCSWNFVLFSSLFSQHLSSHRLYMPSHPFLLILFFIAILIWAQCLSVANYFYFLMPIFLFSTGLNMLGFDFEKTHNWINFMLEMQIMDKRTRNALFKKWLKTAVIMLILTVLFISLMVAVFFERSILSLIFVLISPFPFCFQLRGQNDKILPLRIAWFSLCLFLALFPLLDTVGTIPRPMLVIFAQFVSFLVILLYNELLRKGQQRNSQISIAQILHGISLILLLYEKFMGFTPLMPIFAWLTLPLAFLLPFFGNLTSFSFHCFHPTKVVASADRLVLWSGSLQLPFALLSLSYEALFLCLFSLLLFIFVHLMVAHENPDAANNFWATSNFIDIKRGNSFSSNTNANLNLANKDFLNLQEWLRALFLVVCIEMAFFGTGNIASLNSFNPSFLRHFLSIFSPFTMATLLLLKVFIPFFLVSLHFISSQTKNGQQQLARLSTHVAIITNTMAMVFFYCLKTDGSWLQIGISISNYVICLVCSAVTYLLLHFSHCILHFNSPSLKII